MQHIPWLALVVHMLSLRLGWRNLWRNGKRTAITLTAVTLNCAVLIITYAMMDGLFQDMLSNATNQVVGEVQVHAQGFLAERSMYQSIPDPERILAAARDSGIPAASRSYGFGLLSHGNKSSGAQFWGVDPTQELGAFDLGKGMAQGEFLPATPAAETAGGNLVLGAKLARSLNAAPGNEIVAVVQAADGSLGNEVFRVAGILKSVGESVDRSAALLCRRDFEELFVSEGRVHEIAFNSRGRVPPEAIEKLIASAATGLDARIWRKLMPAISDMANVSDVILSIFALIFVLAAAAGVLNTILMSTFERMREFGVQKALGATPGRILLDVTSEAFLLAFLASILGCGIGVSVSAYLQASGLDMSSLIGSFTAVGVAFDPVWHARLGVRTVLEPVLILWVVCLLTALYPAAKAARIDPVRAMTHV